MKHLSELQILAQDLYNGVPTKFNGVDGTSAIRNMLNEACGGDFNYKNFREYKYRVFSLIEELVDVTLGTIITDQYEPLAEVKTVALGDRPYFKVNDNSLFRVARIASGTNDLRRQKITNRQFTVDTDDFGVKIYTETELLQAGRIDFPEWIQRIGMSFAHDLGIRIHEAIKASYSLLNATYGVTGSLDEDALLDMVSHVEAKTGKKAVIYATRKMARKLTGALDKSDAMKDTANAVGYIDTIAGVPIFLLPQAHKVGTDEFEIDDNTILIVPDGEKIVRVLIEGEAVVLETSDEGARNDRQVEYMLTKKMGVGVISTSVYGIYKVTA